MGKPIRYLVIVAGKGDMKGWFFGEFTNKNTAIAHARRRLKGSGERFFVWDTWENETVYEELMEVEAVA